MKTKFDQALSSVVGMSPTGPTLRSGSLVPTGVRSLAPVCPQPERPRRDDVVTAAARTVLGTTYGTAAGAGRGVIDGSATAPGLPVLAPPIT